MNSLHTPGPWHRNIRPATKYPVIFAGRNTHIAKVIDTGIGLSEVEANTDLITAAPELLAALRDLVSAEGLPEGFADRAQLIAAARAAIRKATGLAS